MCYERACSTHDSYNKCIQHSSKNHKTRNHLEGLSKNGRIILKQILKEYGVRVCTVFSFTATDLGINGKVGSLANQATVGLVSAVQLVSIQLAS